MLGAKAWRPTEGWSDERVLQAEAYRKYLERIVRTVSGRYDLEVIFSAEVQTDGRVIEINPRSPLLSPLPNLEQKTLALLGQLAHEYFHIEYTDFRAYRLLNAKYRHVSSFRRQMMYRLFNILEDAAIERIGCQHYVGLFRRGIYFTNHVAFSQMPALDEMERRGAPAMQILSQAILMYAILGRVKGRWLNDSLAQVFRQAQPLVAMGREEADSLGRLRQAEKLYRLLEPWMREMEEKGLTEDHSFQYVKNERLPSPAVLGAGQEGEGRNRGGQEGEESERFSWEEELGHLTFSVQTAEAAPDKQDQDGEKAGGREKKRWKKWFPFWPGGLGKKEHGSPAERAETVHLGTAPTGIPADPSPSPKERQESGISAQAVIVQDGEDLRLKEALRQLERALHGVRAKAHKEEEERKSRREWNFRWQQAGSRLATGLHEGIQLQVCREFALSPEDEQRYQQLAAEIRPLEQVMVRQWQIFLQEREGTRETGLSGGKLDERRLWREDGRAFYRRRQDGSAPALAVLVLVDESGSMKAVERWQHATRACLLLEAVCRQNRIPFAVIGHMALYGQPQVVHHHYVDFASSQHGQRKHLALLGAKENTREGLSLRYAGMYLKQAQADGLLGDAERVQPLLLSLSDGEPVHEGGIFQLVGEEAQRDAQLAVKELERQGIGVVGVAIGEKPSAISRIYPRAIEVPDLERLPQRLLRQVMLAAGWAV